MKLDHVETRDHRVLQDKTHNQADLVRGDHKVHEALEVHLDSQDHKDHQDQTVKSKLDIF